MMSILLIGISVIIFAVMSTIGLSLIADSVKIMAIYFGSNNLKRTLKGAFMSLLSFSVGAAMITIAAFYLRALLSTLI